MSHATFTRKAPVVSASQGKAATRAASGGLRIGEPDDAFEQEADRVADEIMAAGGAAKRHWSLPVAGGGTFLQRKCSCGASDASGGQCEKCKEEKESKVLQRKSAGPAGSDVAPPIVHEVLNSPGRPLDKATRNFFEPRFGHDFSKVRVHTGARAAESARAVNSLAYTLGNHIVLGTRHYSPQTTSAKRLLAHELAHVVQQGTGQTLRGNSVSKPGDRLDPQTSLAAQPNMADRELPRLLNATHTLQRKNGDPLEEGKERKSDSATERANEACGKPCGKFPWVEVAPDVFVTVCDDNVKVGKPEVVTAGCVPGRLGSLGFFAGAPAWQMPTCDTCKVTGSGSKAGPTTGLQVGYIQTVEKALSGGVYFKQDAAGKWVWAGNNWTCVDNARDGLPQSTPPWYGPAGTMGPEPFGTCPAMSDTPFVPLPSGQSLTTKKGVTRAAWPLRLMRIDGVFHTWLVAQPATGPMVFIHHWSFKCFVTAELKEDADPCNKTAWQKTNDNELKAHGPGIGKATPVLTGGIANDLKKPC